MLYGVGTAKWQIFVVSFVLNLRNILMYSSTTNKLTQLSHYQSVPQETPVQSDRPIQDQVAWMLLTVQANRIEGMASCKHDRIEDYMPCHKLAFSCKNGSHPEGCRGAKIVPVNNVRRVLVTLLQNKRAMSAFPDSGHKGW